MSDTPWHLKNYKNLLTSKGRIIPVVERLLIQEQLDSTRDTKHLHPSEICRKDWCPRSSWYTINDHAPEESSYSFQKLNIFAEGHAIHSKWQKWLTDAGVLEQAEVPIYDEHYRIMGHADGIINDKKGRAVLEIKSVGMGTIRMEDIELFKSSDNPEALWKKVRQPFPTHLRQLNLYMHCLGIEDGIILYEWKPNQDVKEFAVKFQKELIADILSGCQSVVTALESNVPPRRPMLAESEESKFCKNCPHVKVCWNG